MMMLMKMITPKKPNKEPVLHVRIDPDESLSNELRNVSATNI